MSAGKETQEVFHRLEDRYLLAVGLLLASIVVYAFTGDNRFGQLATVAVQGVTLLVILDASHAPVLAIRFARVIVVLAFLAIIASSASQRHGSRAAVAIVGSMLVIGAPIAIIQRIARRPRIDIMTVAGALCIYLLVGLLFSYVYVIIDIAGGPFFAQTSHPTAVDFVYFSFITMTTVGYGDLTSQLDLGRMLAVSEALFGQLYLVAAVALLISNLGHERPAAAERAAEAARENDDDEAAD
jgi:hypothetical protein